MFMAKNTPKYIKKLKRKHKLTKNLMLNPLMITLRLFSSAL